MLNAEVLVINATISIRVPGVIGATGVQSFYLRDSRIYVLVDAESGLHHVGVAAAGVV